MKRTNFVVPPDWDAEQAAPVCVPFAIAAFTGTTLAAQNPTPGVFREGTKPYRMRNMARRMHFSDFINISYVRYLRPKQIHFRGPRPFLQDHLPLNGTGLVWVREGESLHMLAFDGKLVMDTLSPRLTWVYDHDLALSEVLGLFLPEAA